MVVGEIVHAQLSMHVTPLTWRAGTAIATVPSATSTCNASLAQSCADGTESHTTHCPAQPHHGAVGQDLVNPSCMRLASLELSDGEGCVGCSGATSAQDDIHSPLAPESVSVPATCYDDDAASARCWAPGQPLRIAYITWNMANRPPSMEQVRAHCIRPNAHLVVVATQENGPYVGSGKMQRRWLRAVRQDCLAQRYVVVGRKAMSALHLVVFARTRDVARHVSHVHCARVRTGSLRHVCGNKGAVAVALVLSLEPCGTMTPHSSLTQHAFRDDALYSPAERVCNPLSPACLGADQPCPHRLATTPSTCDTPHCWTLLCVNAHLPAHQKAVHRRNACYRHIVRHLVVGLRGPHRGLFARLLRHAAPVVSATASCGDAARRRSGGDAPCTDRSTSHPVATAPGLLSREVSLLNLRSIFRVDKSGDSCDGEDAEDSAPGRGDVTEQFDLTLFGGDLNYRINGARAAIETTIRLYPHVREILLRNDQLLLEQNSQTVFTRFHEGKLAFRPTYKYEVDPVSHVTQNVYSLSDKKNRLPAYCDRVLYKTRRHSAVRRVAIKLYTDVPHVRSSDHRPVVAIFDVQTRAAA